MESTGQELIEKEVDVVDALLGVLSFRDKKTTARALLDYLQRNPQGELSMFGRELSFSERDSLYEASIGAVV